MLRLEEDEGAGRAEYMKVSRVWLLFPRAVQCSHLLKAAPMSPLSSPQATTLTLIALFPASIN